MNIVVVTGATSMIGVATIKSCIDSGCEVIALVRENNAKLSRLPDSEKITVVKCNLENLNKLDLNRNDCDVFYHFGWAYTDRLDREDINLQLENIKFSLDAVDLAHRLGCKKFIGAGTQSEYGVCSDVIYPNVPVKPQNAYGIVKYAAGKLCEKRCEQLGIISVWTRIFSVYGALINPDSVINYAISKFKAKEKAYFTSGTQIWNFLFEEDCGVIFKLLGEKCDKSMVLCVANKESRPLRDYIKDIADVIGDNVDYELAKEDHPGVVSLNPDVSLLYSITGFDSITPFKEGIRKIVKSN